jgi:outer membrane protein assembly factor BamB
MTIMRARAALLLLASLSLSGCDLLDRYIGGPPKTPLPGERRSMLRGDERVEADPRLAGVAVQVPDAVPIDAWPQPGGTPAHAMQNLAVAGIGVAWSTSIGTGASRDGRVTGTPVVADGRVYAVDAATLLSAVDAGSGTRLWQADLATPDSRSTAGGGGVAVSGGMVFATTGQAQVIALDASTGKELWRAGLTAPSRSGPTIAGNRVFAISVDNQLHALDVASGRKLWSQAGITENAGLFGASSPAVDGNTVVAAFSSGELFALRVESGRVMWSDSLTGSQRSDALSLLSDVRGLPVLDRGVVYAVSHSGRMAAIDLRGGARIWEQNVGSFNTPWLAGDHLFVTTLDAEVVALRRRDGRINWVTPLEQFTDPQRKRGRIVWTGPTLVGGRLVVFNSEAQAVALAPATGQVMERLRLPGSVTLPPAVARGSLYVVTDDAQLVALR